ncbi:MAG: restriction endonuclease [Myxococcota bacterium]|nr:restriction endonuclease [Myxococcota bacterium]
MPVPPFHELMLPMLRLAADGKEHTLAEAMHRLAEEFYLSEQERMELLPSGRQRRFNNRVGWAKTHLKKAGLLRDEARGRFRITEQGREVLASSPDKLSVAYLEERFPSLREFRGSGEAEQAPPSKAGSLEAETPEEVLEDAYQALRKRLADELLERIKACSPAFFEKLVVDLLVAMGYGGSRRDAGQVLGKSGDGGIDGIIKQDKLGLDVVYLQAKRWDTVVGRPVVQAFAGSLEGHRARKGILITTSQFSQEAYNYVERIEKKIVLIDGAQLCQLMIDHGVGVSEAATYQVKKVDADYFSEEA